MMTSTCLKALKIQSVQTKTIIKMTPAQLQSMIQPPKRLSDQTTPIHSTVWKDNTVPRLQEKVCGLFNQEIDSNKDTGPLDMDNITIINNNQNKSKFAIRKSNANLHINLSQTIQPPTQQTEECDLDLEHLDINNFLTPRTEMQYLSLFSSIEPVSDDNFKESNIEIDEELNCILTSELYDNTKINVQANELAFDFELVQNESSLGLALDHAYSNKRKLSLDIEDNSIFSQDSFSLQTSSPAPSTSTEPTKKKKLENKFNKIDFSFSLGAFYS